jgi:hypothetical protein
VKALCVITPAAISPQYFRETAEEINAAAGGPPGRAKMVEIMCHQGFATEEARCLRHQKHPQASKS